MKATFVAGLVALNVLAATAACKHGEAASVRPPSPDSSVTAPIEDIEGKASGVLTVDNKAATLNLAYAKRKSDAVEGQRSGIILILTDKRPSRTALQEAFDMGGLIIDERVQALTFVIDSQNGYAIVVSPWHYALRTNQRSRSVNVSGVIKFKEYSVRGGKVIGRAENSHEIDGTKWSYSVSFEAPIQN